MNGELVLLLSVLVSTAAQYWNRQKNTLFVPVLSSPEWEGPLLVSPKPAAVDGRGTGHCVEMVRTVG